MRVGETQCVRFSVPKEHTILVALHGVQPLVLLFDLDGTLVDTERESAEAMARALRNGQGIAIEQSDRDFMVGRSWVEIYRRLASDYRTLRWTRDQLIAATATQREVIFAESGVKILPGAREAILRFSDWRKAIVTGSSRIEARQALRALDGSDSFAFVLASEDVDTSKPAPDGYLLAAERFGVDAGNCIVVEDSEAGIAAGIAAGMKVIAVRAGCCPAHDQRAAHILIDTLHELSEELVARATLGES